MASTLSFVREERRVQAPATTPQALAWDGRHLWMGSRDLRRIYVIDPNEWRVVEEVEAPGIPWAAVAENGSVCFTIGEDPDDDRYIYRYEKGSGFQKLFACPELTGSYLSFDGHHLYLSQWYKGRILCLDSKGVVGHSIEIGEEICGHAFVDGSIYVIRGTEKDGESWRLARLDPQQRSSDVTDLASVPFASRSLTFDGKHFWSNHRAAGEMVSFSLPR
jgi:hypothetical protein